ncbi:hypothetical protein OD91_1158 [Lutibacter sp. Hel_I_33_5]|uniref:hypothetical protein n=1 Tax=Lutibacter sp. Hel_I_33_5 TaxID=1566289 RepID=UPI00119E3338|nr:hypothetical protein [Lutibacter sp. Hel_I_33_5]TVZ55885.1 hypothetical protein OD91_1158 [Lutibacter sp. Hel_I_33_5]
MKNVFKIPVKDASSILLLFLRKLGLLIIFIWALYFDGTEFASKNANAQMITNIFMLVAFCMLYYRSVKRTRKLMLYAVVIGFIGEYFFSIFLGMYTYRLGNLPWYIPLGHAALYARVYTFTKFSIVRKYSIALNRLLYFIISTYALFSLLMWNDVFGFVMTIAVFLILMKRKKDRLFFLTMYIMVVILELFGTAYEVWKWPSTAFGIFDILPSHNPPSGISLFYFLLDVGSFVLYIQLHKTTWKRVKRFNAQKSI